MEQGNALLIEQLAQRQAQRNSSQESSAQAVEQAQNQARIRELGQRRRRASAKTPQRPNSPAPGRQRRQRLPEQRAQRRLGTARTEIASLKQQATDLQAANQQLRDQQLRDQQAAQQAKTDKTGGAGRVVINDTAPKDVRVSYAVGAWYAESAPQETGSPPSARSWTCRPSRRGFTDKINNRLQLPQAKLSAELDGAQQQLETAMLSKNEKESKALLAAAAKEKGAVKMPDGVIYRVLDKGKSPSVSDKNEICSTSKNSSPRAKNWSGKLAAATSRTCRRCSRASSKQLGLGGSKILTP